MGADRIPLPDTGGALWLCSLRDIAHDPQAMLDHTSASTVVCLMERGELERREPDYADWLRAHQGGQALWFPIRNFHAESAESTMPFLELLIDRLGDGVVMHCQLGQGRAGTMAVALLVMLGSTLDDALRAVAANRTFAGPGEGSQWALVEGVARAVAAG